MDNEEESSWFVEIRPKSKKQFTEALSLSPILPQNCRALILRLNKALPTHDALSHLKRVRTQYKTISILLCPSPKAGLSHSEDAAVVLEQLRNENYEISAVQVPARLAETAEEWKEFNAVWPTKYVLTAPPAIDIDEQRLMRQGLQLAQDNGGVVIVDPNTAVRGTSSKNHGGELRIIATASQEAKEQGYPDNPLATNVLLAIQGVSRLERAALLRGDLSGVCNNNPEKDRVVTRNPMHDQQQQQYLCTNYDVYCVREPSVFEAMALLHSRIRRLAFTQAAVDDKDGGITRHMIHALQLTNHRYRAFQLNDKSHHEASKRQETEPR